MEGGGGGEGEEGLLAGVLRVPRVLKARPKRVVGVVDVGVCALGSKGELHGSGQGRQGVGEVHLMVVETGRNGRDTWSWSTQEEREGQEGDAAW